MLGWAASLYAGYASRATCAELAPCRGFQLGAKPFKLSCHIVSASCQASNAGSLGKDDSRGPRPFVIVTVRDRTKRTELGDWSQERREWCFGEALTLEVKPEDEIIVSLHRTQEYDLFVAALALSSTQVGEACVPVSSILHRLNIEDRDVDGIMYVTEGVRFDVLAAGAAQGRVTVAFETKQPPPRKPEPAAGPWCSFEALSARAVYHDAPLEQQPCQADRNHQDDGKRIDSARFRDENIYDNRAPHAHFAGNVSARSQGFEPEKLPAPPPPPPVRLSRPRF